MKSAIVDWKKSPLEPVEVGSLSHYLQGFVHHPRWWFGIFFPQQFALQENYWEHVWQDINCQSEWSEHL